MTGWKPSTSFAGSTAAITASPQPEIIARLPARLAENIERIEALGQRLLAAAGSDGQELPLVAAADVVCTFQVRDERGALLESWRIDADEARRIAGRKSAEIEAILGYAGRAASASPAVGYAHLHQEQQKALLDQAFGKLKGFVLSK